MTDANEKTLEEKAADLENSYVPKFLELFQSIGMNVSPELTREELGELLNDQELFEAALPEGTSLSTLPDEFPEFVEAFNALYSELVSKMMSLQMEAALGELFG